MGDGEDTGIALFASTAAADAIAADAAGIGIGDAVAWEPSAPARCEREPGSFCVEFIADAPPSKPNESHVRGADASPTPS